LLDPKNYRQKFRYRYCIVWIGTCD